MVQFNEITSNKMIRKNIMLKNGSDSDNPDCNGGDDCDRIKMKRRRRLNVGDGGRRRDSTATVIGEGQI
jgi:hypothetical protein